MALKIRLARGGAKKRPFFQIVIADARSPRDGRFVEKVGTYNPMLSHDNEDRIRLNSDRIKYWLSVGAQPTDRVALFLGKANLIEMPAVRETPLKSTPKAKAQERLKAEEEAKLAREEAAKAPPPPAPEPEPEVAAAPVEAEAAPVEAEAEVAPVEAPAEAEAPAPAEDEASA
ncbi:MAG: 30S ribosomal protein S16 [Alphaproteobacteria bacterium]|nr:30S ribosomal protein S16 [Alphaproteobacteria bacterium]